MLTIIACKTSSSVLNLTNMGKVVIQKRVPNRVSPNPAFVPIESVDDTLWFRNDFFIQQLRATSASFINDKLISYSKYTLCYVLVDTKNQQYYEFSSFSDTAKIIRTYRNPDTVSGIHSTALRYYHKDTTFNVDKAIPLKDTLINNISFKRFMLYDSVEKNDYQQTLQIKIVYLDCRRKGRFPFSSQSNYYQKQKGCPIVRKDIIKPEVGGYFYYEYVLLNNSLTLHENKVFDAWEKYAKDHPLK